jgi:hypothetical protein
VAETVEALRAFGLACQAKVLECAASVGDSNALGEYDKAFHACETSIVEVLEAHLAESSARYVEFV